MKKYNVSEVQASGLMKHFVGAKKLWDDKKVNTPGKTIGEFMQKSYFPALSMKLQGGKVGTVPAIVGGLSNSQNVTPSPTTLSGYFKTQFAGDKQ